MPSRMPAPTRRSQDGRKRSPCLRQLDEAAERVREAHVLDRPASTSSSRGEQTRYARHCARETATFSRFRDMRKSMPRGASSPARGRHREEDDRRLLPLELVHRADARRRPAAARRAAAPARCRARRRSRPRRSAPRPSSRSSLAAAARSRRAIAAASSSDDVELPSCSTGSQRRPVPSRVVRSRARRATRAGPRRTRRRRKRQTSGCMRHEWSRKRPMSSGTVACSPSRCSSTERPAPAGWIACVTCASCTGSPSRTSVRAPCRARARRRATPARPRRRRGSRASRRAPRARRASAVPATSSTSASAKSSAVVVALDRWPLVDRLRACRPSPS